MTLPIVALFALVPVAVLAWRCSRPIAVAVGALFVSTCGYALLAWRYPEAHAAGRFEAQRWTAALVGLVGVVELGRAAKVALDGASSVAGAIHGIGPRGWLGLLAFASMAGVGAAHLFERVTGEWGLPAAQIVVSGAMITISVWPGRRA
jgi:hypothetical protein